MDSHTYSVEKLAIVETGRRRRWSDEEKLRIVTESLAGPRLASATARRYGISPGQLFAWRRELRVQPARPAIDPPQMVCVRVEDEPKASGRRRRSRSFFPVASGSLSRPMSIPPP